MRGGGQNGASKVPPQKREKKKTDLYETEIQ